MHTPRRWECRLLGTHGTQGQEQLLVSTSGIAIDARDPKVRTSCAVEKASHAKANELIILNISVIVQSIHCLLGKE